MSGINESAELRAVKLLDDIDLGSTESYTAAKKEIIRVFKRVEALENALRPFSAREKRYSATLPDSFELNESITIGDLRNAKKVLES